MTQYTIFTARIYLNRFMQLVRTYVAPSSIHGLGVFAKEFIPKGKKIWEFTPGFDRKIPKEKFERLCDSAREFIDFYSYKNRVTGAYILPADNDRYTNHSDNPNTQNLNFTSSEGVTIASKNIQVGEEITTNYFELEGTIPKFN